MNLPNGPEDCVTHMAEVDVDEVIPHAVSHPLSPNFRFVSDLFSNAVECVSIVQIDRQKE